MTFPDIARTALRGLQTNKLRAGLSTLGILVGIASIIVRGALVPLFSAYEDAKKKAAPLSDAERLETEYQEIR